jgi:ribonucleotide reductase beta subunit family protein with ferritin-like domain
MSSSLNSSDFFNSYTPSENHSDLKTSMDLRNLPDEKSTLSESTSTLKKSTKFHIPHSSVANHIRKQHSGVLAKGNHSTANYSGLGSRLSSSRSVGVGVSTTDEEDVGAITERISKLSSELNLLTRKLEEKKEKSKTNQSTSVISLINQLAEITSKRKDTSSRYSFFPIKDEEAFSFYKSQESAIWSANEMDFIRDKKDYENLEPRLKHLVDMILGFFAPGDGLIAQNLVFRFLLECETFEEQAMFITQMFIELVHAETYGMTIMVFHPREEDQKRIFSMCEQLPCVKAKVDWMNKYMYADIPKSMRYLAFSACEGIFFSVLFSIIFWFRSKGILQNFIFSNEQISKDEGLHRDFGALLFKREIKKNPFSGWEAQAEQILDEALEIELEFLKALVPEPIDDLSFESLSDYAKVVTDNLRVQLGLGAKYKIKNTLSWMNDISLTQKGNFYECRIGNYQSFSKQEALNWKARVGLEEKKLDVFDTPDQMDF